MTAPIALACPKCHDPIGNDLTCSRCNYAYAKEQGVPVLIDHQTSIFSLEDIKRQSTSVESRLFAVAKSYLPRLSANLSTKRIYGRLRQHLLKQPQPIVLCIGGGDGGIGIEYLTDPKITIVNTDVVIRPSVDYAVDAHSLPFVDASFDLVVAQAVLEHVIDPIMCVSEIHRVLRPGGIVFAETPFMQQVHLGRYDFTRFTHLGHRHLFRAFREIESGQVASAGTALAWSLTNFFTSFTASRRSRLIVYALGRIMFGWIKYLDPILAAKPGSWDAAAAFYFLGTRTDDVLSDTDLLKEYRGMH